MNQGSVRFSIEWQDAAGGEWHTLAWCNSLEYARLIAAAGIRRRPGASYRVLYMQTGKRYPLPAGAAAAG